MLFREDKVARADAEAVRKNVGWYCWTHDLVEVRGKDAHDLLDYICVNVISDTVGVSKYTTMLDDNGKILTARSSTTPSSPAWLKTPTGSPPCTDRSSSR